ncbi:ATP-binding protein [Treponema sp. OMZ 855]|uniref:ATP-binding protein n=1 Tax=Treponema sp. OMZ 855 TaxID=1643512 RepID=UPI0020A31B2D|nr:ATP-binding protein [Treponema sp. OMZ 855]UTC51488.1 ATP-binding protein [Treponema sp. OMZ 855]
MNFSRKLPVGIQSFKVLREDRYLYVDKTSHIFRLVQSGRVYFLSRPRRFGKSLFLSTLEAYFLGQKELFRGLYLEEAEAELAVQENRATWQEYPVLYFDFNTGQYDTLDSLINRIELFLSPLEKKYAITPAQGDLAQRLEEIIKQIYETTHKQVVILVDEYDKPLLQTMGVNETLNEQYRNTLKAFYSVIKTCDQYIRFAFLTGVTKFSKISIFSDLNNLEDISLRNDYAGICGITEQELEQNFEPEIEALSIAEGLTRSKTLATLKKQYDGYLFAKAGVNVYNPFSLLSAFKAKDFGSYWFSTGTPTFLVNYLKEAHYFIPDLDGNVELNESGLETYRAVTENALPILFQSGYLTIIGYIKEARLYKLGFPNDEVRYGFLENLLPAYSDLPLGDTGKSIWQFVQDIREGKVDSFMERMKSIIAGIPYDNFTEENRTIRIAMDGDGSMQKQVCHANLQLKDVHGCTSLSKLREQNYQTAVYLVFALMGQFVQTEVHCSTGRADCIVWTAETIYLFEFKLTGNGSAEDALNQIKEKEYAAKYQMDGKKVVLIGVGFDEQKRTIKDWQVAHG